MDDGTVYRLIVEVPGATKKNLEVVPGPVPGTMGVRVEGREEKADIVLRSERGIRSGPVRYHRIVPIPWNAEASAAKYELADGILTITVPKQKAQPREAPSQK